MNVKIREFESFYFLNIYLCFENVLVFECTIDDQHDGNKNYSYKILKIKLYS
jgi:hypothetical protein